MSGKKAAISVVVLVIVLVILIFMAFQFFFATYEPQKSNELSAAQSQSIEQRPIQLD
nr:hypothetical protein [Lysinibacillus timonensis]